MNALTIPPMAIGDMQTLAVAIAKSSLFGIRTPEQALVLMAIAQAEGRHPVEAARDYDIINNRPAKKAEAMLRDFIQAGGKVEWHSLTDELADATFTHPQTGKVRIDWDMKRAATAFGKKDMYTKFPRQMLRSRVVSEGVRTLWPLATSGMYEPGEVADIPPEHNVPTLEAKAEAPEPGTLAAVNAEVPLRAAAAPMPRAARIAEKARVYDGPVEGDNPKYTEHYVKHGSAIELLDEKNGNQWLENLEMLLTNAQTQAEVIDLAGHSSVGNATATAPEAIKGRIAELLANAYGRFAEPDLPEVEITGSEKVMSG